MIKKIITLLIGLFISLVVNAQYTAIPDANFELALYDLGYDNILGDGQVPTTFINTVAVLSVPSKNITDLTGIEGFAELLILNCENNNITSLDLSNNPVLGITGEIYLNDNNLSYLDLRNGNNHHLDNESISLLNNPNLTCVLVDDISYSIDYWDEVVDLQTYLSETYCNYTAIPDGNFEAALEALGYDDITGDNQVPTVLIENLTSLNVNSSSISDLKGIEAFTSLITLKVEYNNLEDSGIDLSANTVLEVLSIRANGNVTSLDVSNNINLRKLNCRNTAITELNLSSNLALQELKCQFTSIASLDVSLNTSLTSLTCQDNSLLNLNVQNGNNTNFIFFQAHNNPNLTCVLVDDAEYSNDETIWTDYIDATTSFSDTECIEYTAIPDASFEAALYSAGHDDTANDGKVLTANINTITNLSISSANISDLTGIQDFTALSLLNCNTNSLTSLDLSSNTNLTYLNCAFNTINTLVLSDNLLLTNLDCQNNQLTSIDMSNNSLLTDINISDNLLTIIDVSNNLLLEKLGLSRNSLTTIDVTNNTVLDRLEFYENALTTIDLSNNTALLILEFGENQISNIDLSNNLLLEELYAYNNVALTGSLDLSKHTSLIDLDLTNNDLTSLDFRNGNNANYSYFSVIGNSNLICINVDDASYSTNNWTNIDAEQSFTETGYCRYTAIPDTTFEDILDYLGYDDISGDGQVPTALIEEVTFLNVMFEPIEDYTGIQDFTALEYLDISTNTKLSSIDLSSNLNLISLVSQNSFSLGDLDLSNNLLLEILDIRNTDVTSLNLRKNAKLKKLICYDPSLSDIDLSQNTDLVYLDVKYMVNLTSLNVQNGNNTNVTYFDTLFCNSLTCISVDDSTWSTNNWANIESGTSFTSGYCRYTQIPDTNFEAALSAYDDTANDGQVPTTLIEAVTLLYIPNKSISNLTGIEDFIALTYLNIQNNNLSNLDLSNNPLLEELNCAHNNLSYLDLSENTILNSLYADNNSLVELDLSANIQLQYLYLVSNQLTYLNLQNGNNTSSQFFDVTENSTLTCILVDNAAYSSDNWTSIDGQTNFSDTYCRYTTIPDANFEARLEAQNKDDISGDGKVPTALIESITNLNLSGQSISDLTGIEDFTALSLLNCNTNTITTLDLSLNTNLTYLNCYFNTIETLVLNDNLLLTYLNCQNNQLSSIDVSNNSSLTELNVSDNQLTTLNIKNNVLLETLKFDENSLIEIDVSSNTLLERLEFFGNALTEIDVSNNTALLILEFGENQISNINLSNNLLLEELYAYNNVALTGSLDLSKHTALIDLDLTNNDLTSLDFRNGNNANYSYFSVIGNSNLTCINVDDVSYSTNNWTDIDSGQNFTETGYCRYTAIPDTNFEKRLRALGYDDADFDSLDNFDGYVPTALIEVVGLIDLSLAVSGAITYLTGLEDFTALDNLTIDDIVMTSIDLSSNLNLLNLYARNTSLTSLDLSSNTLLEAVYIDNSSDLSTVNLQNGANTNLESAGDFQATNMTSLTCVLVDDATYSTNTWTFAIDPQITFSETFCNAISLSPVVYLEGAFTSPNSGEETLMRDDLRVGGYIPTTSPYTDAITCEAAVFDITGDNAIVDWIWVELRDETDNTVIIDSQSALLQRDGDVVGIDGVSSLEFSQDSGNYYIVISHRNHISIRSTDAIALSTSLTSIDFSSVVDTVVGGSNAIIDMGNSIYAMPSGDYDGNGEIQTIDASSVISVIGSSGYHKADMDMNGEIQTIDIDNVINKNVGKGQQF